MLVDLTNGFDCYLFGSGIDGWPLDGQGPMVQDIGVGEIPFLWSLSEPRNINERSSKQRAPTFGALICHPPTKERQYNRPRNYDQGTVNRYCMSPTVSYIFTGYASLIDRKR